MSLTYIDQDMLNELLRKNYTFTFGVKFKIWYVILMIIILTLGLLAVLFLRFFYISLSRDYPLLSPINIIILIPVILIEICLLINIPRNMSHYLILSPDSIKLKKRNDVYYECLYSSINNIEEFKDLFNPDELNINVNSIRIESNDGKSKEIFLADWETPKPLPSLVLIKRIIFYYLENL